MMDLIIQMLEIDDFIGKSETIDIAKGKYKRTTNLKEAWVNHKRKKAWQRLQR